MARPVGRVLAELPQAATDAAYSQAGSAQEEQHELSRLRCPMNRDGHRSRRRAAGETTNPRWPVSPLRCTAHCRKACNENNAARRVASTLPCRDGRRDSGLTGWLRSRWLARDIMPPTVISLREDKHLPKSCW